MKKIFKKILKLVIWSPFIFFFLLYFIEVKLGFNLYSLYLDLISNMDFFLNFLLGLIVFYWNLYFNLYQSIYILRKIYFFKTAYELKFYKMLSFLIILYSKLLVQEIQLRQSQSFFKFLKLLDWLRVREFLEDDVNITLFFQVIEELD